MGLSITGNKDSEWFSVCAPFSSHVGFLEAQAILRAPFKPYLAFFRLKTVGRVLGGDHCPHNLSIDFYINEH